MWCHGSHLSWYSQGEKRMINHEDFGSAEEVLWIIDNSYNWEWRGVNDEMLCWWSWRCSLYVRWDAEGVWDGEKKEPRGGAAQGSLFLTDVKCKMVSCFEIKIRDASKPLSGTCLTVIRVLSTFWGQKWSQSSCWGCPWGNNPTCPHPHLTLIYVTTSITASSHPTCQLVGNYLIKKIFLGPC